MCGDIPRTPSRCVEKPTSAVGPAFLTVPWPGVINGSMRRTAQAWALALTLTTLASAPAFAYDLLGGRTLGVLDSALHVEVGYPVIGARYHLPVLKDLEVIPKLTLRYAPLGASEHPGTVGNEFGLDFRYTFYESGAVALAVVARTAFVLSYTDPVVFGMQLALPGGLQFGWAISDSITLSAGVHVPVTVFFTDVVTVVLPFDFEIGAEIAITRQMNLSVQFDVGPVLFFPKGGTSVVGLDLEGTIGIEYLF